MGQEDAVYLAKLAEQAERYEGMKLPQSRRREKKTKLGMKMDVTNAQFRDGREHEDCCFRRC